MVLPLAGNPTVKRRIISSSVIWQAVRSRISCPQRVMESSPLLPEPFARKLGLDFVCEGKKPLPQGYRRAGKALDLPPKQILAVGDQFFTDVLGAKLAGLAMALCVPIEPETHGFLQVKRVLERPLWSKTKRRFSK